MTRMATASRSIGTGTPRVWPHANGQVEMATLPLDLLDLLSELPGEAGSA